MSARELPPTVFVLFGANGDLARRMVLPAFFELAGRGLLPGSWALIGADRGQMTDEDFRAHVHEALTEFGPQPEPASWARFASRLRCAGGGFDATDPGRLLDVLARPGAASAVRRRWCTISPSRRRRLSR